MGNEHANWSCLKVGHTTCLSTTTHLHTVTSHRKDTGPIPRPVLTEYEQGLVNGDHDTPACHWSAHLCHRHNLDQLFNESGRASCWQDTF